MSATTTSGFPTSDTAPGDAWFNPKQSTIGLFQPILGEWHPQDSRCGRIDMRRTRPVNDRPPSKGSNRTGCLCPAFASNHDIGTRRHLTKLANRLRLAEASRLHTGDHLIRFLAACAAASNFAATFDSRHRWVLLRETVEREKLWTVLRSHDDGNKLLPRHVCERPAGR